LQNIFHAFSIIFLILLLFIIIIFYTNLFPAAEFRASEAGRATNRFL